MNPRVDEFYNKLQKWPEEFNLLRTIVLECGLTEEFKWKHPCYTFNNNNVVLIHGFKEYCALLFFKGALLKDPSSILISQSENVQAGRQIRFTKVKEITEKEKILKAYIYEAIEVEKAGLKVNLKKNQEYTMPEELKVKLDEYPELSRAFAHLTPGRQRAYLLHFTQPKQSKTRISRIYKYIPQILEGRGLND